VSFFSTLTRTNRSQAITGAFGVGLLGLAAAIFFNQENDAESEVTLDNIEDYL
jgi:hypothetical protein